MPASIDPPPHRTRSHRVELAEALPLPRAQSSSAMTIAGGETVQKDQPTGASLSGAKASPGRNRYRYRPQFGIVVICDSERAQEAAYRRLQRAGFKQLKVVTV